MATLRKSAVPAIPEDETAEAERLEREDAVFAAASQNSTIVSAAQITNGMPAHVVRQRILAVAAPGGVK